MIIHVVSVGKPRNKIEFSYKIPYATDMVQRNLTGCVSCSIGSSARGAGAENYQCPLYYH